jgi:aryl-phospho-beta-D-glucosidase BglC (GH1 family)
LIQRSGLNSVRIPLHYKFFLPGGGGFEILDQVLDWCKRAGVRVILDMHCAPGGQTGANIDDSWGYPWLYESLQDQELICKVWRDIAQRYRDTPTVIGYDLLNEPIPHFPRLSKYNERLEPLYRRVAKAIREVDPDQAIFLEAAQWDTNFKVFGPPFDANVVYEFHTNTGCRPFKAPFKNTSTIVTAITCRFGWANQVRTRTSGFSNSKIFLKGMTSAGAFGRTKRWKKPPAWSLFQNPSIGTKSSLSPKRPVERETQKNASPHVPRLSILEGRSMIF